MTDSLKGGSVQGLGGVVRSSAVENATEGTWIHKVLSMLVIAILVDALLFIPCIGHALALATAFFLGRQLGWRAFVLRNFFTGN